MSRAEPAEAAVTRLVGTDEPRLREQLSCLIKAPDSLGKGRSRSFEPP
jgi:hypothetical protein